MSNPSSICRTPKLTKSMACHRFPGGESYCDLIKRLDSVVVDMEQQVIPTLVVSHVSVLQILIAYFRNSPVEKCMDINVPLHTIIKFTPSQGGGWSESVHELSRSDEGAMSKVVSDSDISQITNPMTD
jgi:broad specificity phosphatase PhoE